MGRHRLFVLAFITVLALPGCNVTDFITNLTNFLTGLTVTTPSGACDFTDTGSSLTITTQCFNSSPVVVSSSPPGGSSPVVVSSSPPGSCSSTSGWVPVQSGGGCPLPSSPPAPPAPAPAPPAPAPAPSAPAPAPSAPAPAPSAPAPPPSAPAPPPDSNIPSIAGQWTDSITLPPNNSNCDYEVEITQGGQTVTLTQVTSCQLSHEGGSAGGGNTVFTGTIDANGEIKLTSGNSTLNGTYSNGTINLEWQYTGSQYTPAGAEVLTPCAGDCTASGT
jgi:hypothetical protein